MQSIGSFDYYLVFKTKEQNQHEVIKGSRYTVQNTEIFLLHTVFQN